VVRIRDRSFAVCVWGGGGRWGGGGGGAHALFRVSVGDGTGDPQGRGWLGVGWLGVSDRNDGE
jgi:hypothetical protein